MSRQTTGERFNTNLEGVELLDDNDLGFQVRQYYKNSKPVYFLFLLISSQLSSVSVPYFRFVYCVCTMNSAVQTHGSEMATLPEILMVLLSS